MTRKTPSSSPPMSTDKERKDCFIVMPIADMEGYEAGHFKRVYQNIIAPSCKEAGFHPVRADDVGRTNLIHVDILGRLLEAEMVICDLSGHNPNVLFELGIRQAFDKPTVLIQEKGTPSIFDISTLRYTDYPRAMRYDSVLEVQQRLVDNLKETYAHRNDDNNVNSIIRLLSLSKPAEIKNTSDPQSAQLSVLISEVRSLKESVLSNKKPAFSRHDDDDLDEEATLKELKRISGDIDATVFSLPDKSDPTLNKESRTRMKNLLREAETIAKRNPTPAISHMLRAMKNQVTFLGLILRDKS